MPDLPAAPPADSRGLSPLPGFVLVRRPTLADTLPGGRIILAEQTVRQWTNQQAEIVAVGEAPFPEDPDEPEGPCTMDGRLLVDHRLRPGAWVLTKPYGWLATDTPNQYVLTMQDIVGVFG